MVSTSRILVAVVQMCYEAKDWDALNENIMLLTKRRSQLKQVNVCFPVGSFLPVVCPNIFPFFSLKQNFPVLHKIILQAVLKG